MKAMDKAMGIGKHFSILNRIAKKCPNRTFGMFKHMKSENRKDGIYETTNFRDTSLEWELRQTPKEGFLGTSWQEACDILEA